jgi:nitroreductase
MAEHSRHQQKIIKRYYENRDDIALQRLQELVTELYLATGKKRQQHWKSIVLHLEKLGVQRERIDRLVEKDDAAEVAKLVQQLTGK